MTLGRRGRSAATARGEGGEGRREGDAHRGEEESHGDALGTSEVEVSAGSG